MLGLKPATLRASSPPHSGLYIPEASPPRTQRTRPILTGLVARKRGGTTALPGVAARNSAGFRQALGSLPPDLKTRGSGEMCALGHTSLHLKARPEPSLQDAGPHVGCSAGRDGCAEPDGWADVRDQEPQGGWEPAMLLLSWCSLSSVRRTQLPWTV